MSNVTYKTIKLGMLLRRKYWDKFHRQTILFCKSVKMYVAVRQRQNYCHSRGDPGFDLLQG
jgi:hypothetical protein